MNSEKARYIPVSFTNWDGTNGEAGSKHALTSWYGLLLPPSPDPLKICGVPVGVGFIVVLLGLVLISSQRRQVQTA